MSSGIHVSNLPDSATEKQLKVYFSNPRYGGGHVKQILHPLPHDSAVVLFENTRTVRDIVSKQHILGEQKLSVKPLPRQIFGKITVELEKNVSRLIERKPSVVEELQYIGELTVDFSYETEIYILRGNWYQLEWALHYLDGLLEDGDLDRTPKDRDSKERNKRQDNEDLEVKGPPLLIKHEIKKPNIPMVRKTHNTTEKTGKKEAYDVALQQAIQREQGAKHTSKSKEREQTSNYASQMQQNFDLKGRKKGQYNNDSDDFKQCREARRQTRKKGKQSYENQLDDSGSEEGNYGTYYTGEKHKEPYGKYVAFTNDTNFSENKPRPTRPTVKRTRGIEVAQTDLGEAFGEAPLMRTFTMPNYLKVEVTLDDITKQDTDGIINPTSTDLSSHFAASRAIVLAGGYNMQMEMQEYLDKTGRLDLAQVIHTNAGGTLDKKVTSVLHTASPPWIEDDSDTATHYLVCTYINCFMYADSKLWLQSIATPVISAGAFGYPLDVCIQAFYDALLLFSIHGQQTSNHLKEIRLICFDEDTSVAAIVILQSLFDCDKNQSISAATDRYNSRCDNSKFGAEKFSTGAVKKAEKTRTQQKNKNAVKHTKKESNDEKYKSRANKEKSEDVSKADDHNTDYGDTDVNKKQKSSSFTRDKKEAEKTGINKEQDEEDFEAHISSQISNLSGDDDDDDDAEDRGRRSPVLESSDTKVDLKKSMMGIDRPKFQPDSDGEDGGGEVAGDFGVGMIDADRYFQKFDDLVSDNRTRDAENDRDEQDNDQNKEDAKQLELTRGDNEDDTQDYRKAEIVCNVDKEDGKMEDFKDTDNVMEASHENPGVDNHDELHYKEDHELRQGETEINVNSFQVEESKYEFVDDAEISAALDRELGIDSILVANGGGDVGSSNSMNAKNADCEDGDEEYFESYTGPKVLED